MNNFQNTKYIKKLYLTHDHISFRGHFLKKYSIRDKSIRDVLLENIGELHNKRIIDIGAGNGSFLKKLKTNHPDNTYAALDIASNPALQKQTDIEYHIYEGNDLPRNIGTYDIVLMMHMLYHVKDIEKFLMQVHNVFCKKRTRLFITTKSKNTMPNIEKLFQKSIHSTPLACRYSIPAERSEAHFCLENGLNFLKKEFSKAQIKEEVITTNLAVDNKDDLIRYILLTPQYAEIGKDPKDLQCIKNAINRELADIDLFNDHYTEVIYDIKT